MNTESQNSNTLWNNVGFQALNRVALRGDLWRLQKGKSNIKGMAETTIRGMHFKICKKNIRIVIVDGVPHCILHPFLNLMYSSVVEV